MELLGKSVTILGVRIDSTSKAQVLSQVREAIEKKQKKVIVTPNPEILLASYTDAQLRESLNASDISVPDGFGILFVSPLQRLELIKGRELAMDLIELANQNGYRIALLGNTKGNAQEAKDVLLKKYSHIKLYAFDGPDLDTNAKPGAKDAAKREKDLIDTITKIKPHIILVGFGAPRQEKWIQLYKDVLPAIIFMTVGGTFDTISGRIALPPAYWPRSLEWIWRLIQEPKRITRILNATIGFPYKVLLSRYQPQEPISNKKI
jgi:N-acetylglucosaminyldiphosphoundecaprenol N-acetyl-beta-D-mannosaminyltransferase